ncbi:AAA family ATPase [Amycolatopsis sp. NPDC049159]|uniref:AAA family ATPase n=1 Tax=Amycolatopsis sp. NPDC049159 TaxID=3157210 RepID=UPI0033EB2C29
MADQRMDELQIEGLTSILSARVRLGAMNVLVGANGAGKSNFIQALGLLGRLADSQLERYAVFHGGASSMINAGNGGLARINIHVVSGLNHYGARLTAAANDSLVFDQEEVYRPSPEDPFRTVLGDGHRETKLGEARKGPTAQVAEHIIALLRECRVYHFDDTSRDAPVKRQVPTADNIALREDAENLAAVLFRLKNSKRGLDKAAYRRIRGAVRLVAPFLQDFLLEDELGTDTIRLRWIHRDFDRVFSAEQMSDGTLRFICLATLLFQPELPGLVVLDEPELGLHPFAISILSDMLKQASKRSQVIIATQSVTLMNQFTVDDLIVVETGESGSVFRRRTEEQLRSWLADYSLGELWEKNILGGQPGSAGSFLDD